MDVVPLLAFSLVGVRSSIQRSYATSDGAKKLHGTANRRLAEVHRAEKHVKVRLPFLAAGKTSKSAHPRKRDVTNHRLQARNFPIISE